MTSKFTVKFSAVYKKFEDYLSVIVVAFMAIFPLTVKVIESSTKRPIINNENILVNIVFVFSCIAGAITWREDKHISLASLSDMIKPKFNKIIKKIRNGAVSAILFAIFISSFSEFFMFFSQKIWGVSTRFFYTILPLAYFVMLFRVCVKKENWVSTIIGLVVGLYIASGPFGVVLSSVFHVKNVDFFITLFDSWLWFSSHAFVPLLILLIAFAIIGVPLFIALAGIAFLCFSYTGGGYVEIIPQVSYEKLTDSSIAAIPLFTIVGFLLSQGSAGKRLVDVFNSLFGWFRGGTVIASVLVITFFTMFTGASGVTILALGVLLTMLFVESGYDKDKAQSLITASGALGLLFPPSVAIIMYGTVNYFNVDVFNLFKGSLLPGFILAFATITYGIIQDKSKNRPKFSWKVLGKAFVNGIWELLLPVAIIILYFGNIFTIMQTASFAVLYTYILETFIRKDFKQENSARPILSSFVGSIKKVAESIHITGGVLMILASASGLSYFLIDASVPDILANFCAAHIHSKYLFLFLLNIVLIIVGCLMDIYSAIMIVSPLIIPIATMFDINQVHIGVVFLMNMQLGFLTPPVGMDLFISTYAFDKPLMKVVKDILPFLAIQAVVLLFITYVPWFTTCLL
ncbi:MAG: TRAP transporter large permease [Treponemataceae bacterium]